MNSKLDNEMKTGPLSLGDPCGTNSIGGGAAPMAHDGSGLIGFIGAPASCEMEIGTFNGVHIKSSWLSYYNQSYTVGQRIDDRIASLTKQIDELKEAKAKLEAGGALSLPYSLLQDVVGED